MNQYKILMFDLDDTLIDNYKNTKFAFKIMLEQSGEVFEESKFERWYDIDKTFWRQWREGLIPLPNELKEEKGKKSDKYLNWVRAQRVLRYFNNNITLEKAIELNNIYMSALNECVEEIDGACDTLKKLSELGYCIIVVTNGPNIATQGKLGKIGTLKYINKILSADMFGYSKPDTRFFDEVKKVMNDDNLENYIMIGDSQKFDVKFANNIGIDSGYFNRKNEKIEESINPTFVINKLEELLNIL